MRKDQRDRSVIIGILCFTLVMMSVGFAVLSTTLNISGTATVKSHSWDVHFVNVGNEATSGEVEVTTEPTIDGLTTRVDYAVTLKEPGDSYSFTVDVFNNGTLDAKLTSFGFDGVSTAQDVYVNYTVEGMSVNEVLVSGATKTITVTVEYDADVTAAQLPTTDQTLNLSATLNFIQDK